MSSTGNLNNTRITKVKRSDLEAAKIDMHVNIEKLKRTQDSQFREVEQSLKNTSPIAIKGPRNIDHGKLN